MAKTAVEKGKTQAFQQACTRLRDALDRQSPLSSLPSMNVVAAISEVLSYDPNWRREFGDIVAESLQRTTAEKT